MCLLTQFDPAGQRKFRRGIAIVNQPMTSSDLAALTRGSGWPTLAPAEAGLDAGRLHAAVAFAQASQTDWPRDPREALAQRFGDEYGEIIGPTSLHGDSNGLVVRHGAVVATWGDYSRVDMTFSVAKSCLALVAGLAVDAGLIGDVHAPVHQTMDDDPLEVFTSPRNRLVTWHHLLTQTSELEATLWGKPDIADRREGRDRTLGAPGTFWEYNDVRVNALAYALLLVQREPLPTVFRRALMDRMGTGDSWRWRGYDNSSLLVDGVRVESVSGGGHWGGGMFIAALDLARIGQLMLGRGSWNGARLLSPEWHQQMLVPTALHPSYGYLWWLNTAQALRPSVPASAYAARGAGPNEVWVSPDHDLVIVLRWMHERHVDGFLAKVLDAVVA